MVLAATREARCRSLFALACFQAIIGTFFSPARMAMLPRVVPAEGLLVANSLGPGDAHGRGRHRRRGHRA